jgi:hypothetical protein
MTVSDPRLIDPGPSPFGGHRYSSFFRCPSIYGYEYEGRYLPLYDDKGNIVASPRPGGRNDARPLVLGSLIHLGLAHHYAHLQARQHHRESDYYEPCEAIDVHTENEMSEPGCTISTWAECSEIAKDVTRKYAAHYAFERVRVEYVEEVFQMAIGESRAPLTFRVDLVVRDTGGKVWFVDHKTTGRLLSSHPRSYSMSNQFLSYTLAGQRVYGDQFGGCLLNMIQAGRGETIFRRPDLLAAPGLLAAFPASVERAWKGIQELSSVPAGYWPVAPTEHTCWTRYGPCRHYDDCRLGLRR